MEQIYYTQCPIGYGLGASNGYQIKRITAGYPVAGDFRHLGLRAFPGGGRTLAPVVLRYRRDGEIGEVARLTPRSQEYLTERGLWGRPGGVFAHGVRLEPGELASIGHWPAGLFDHPDWRTGDPEPTRGRPPGDLDPATLASFRPADFATVAPLFAGEDPDWLARVWTALALATREGRTLFLIDEPDRLARSVALLTFGFPASLRGDLTFSTFHDRPEELPGYRLQGTSPVVRPNRMALLAQGIIADRGSRTIEPPVEPADWAITLAGWFTRGDAVAEADWSATEARARGARKPSDPVDLIWSDAWLGPLIGFPAAYRSRQRPDSSESWLRLAEFARWSGRAGIGDEWLRPRGPNWWLDQALDLGQSEQDPAARAALLAHATLRDAWRSTEAATGWGRALAAWFGPAQPTERDEAVVSLFRAIPRAARPSFAGALIRGLTPEAGASVLAQLRANPNADRAMLGPLEAGIAAAQLVASSGDEPAIIARDTPDALLRRLLAEASGLPGALAATLGAVAAVAEDHPGSLDRLAQAVAPAFDWGADDEGRAALDWALRQGDAAPAWLGPALRPGLADLGDGDLFGLLRDATADDLRPRLARAVLRVADDPGLPDDAFRLAVERLLLPLAPRPNDPSWAETYLRRTPSTWDLFRRLYSKESAAIGVPAWLDQARGRGELSGEQAERIDATRRFARSLSSGDPRALGESPIPTGSPGDRALFFRQMLGRLGGTDLAGLPFVLDACRIAWPGAFDPGAEGLANLAKPLAERLAPDGQPPRSWLDRMRGILERLELTRDGAGFEPDGLLAEVVAALPTAVANPWPFRQFLFEDDRAWPTLALLIGQDLGQAPATMAAELVNRWDDKIVKGTEGRVRRFWTLILNATDSPRRGAVVAARARDLQSLGPLPWWDHANHPGSTDDLRDAYARTTPLDPLPTGRWSEVERWLKNSDKKATNLDEPIPMEDRAPEPNRLSLAGSERWRCLQALTEYNPTTPAPSTSREASFLAWQASLPLANLDAKAVYRFLGWVILGIDPTDPPYVDRLAAWFFRVGMTDPRRVSRWVDELAGFEVSAQAQMERAGFVGDLGREIRKLAEESRPSRRA